MVFTSLNFLIFFPAVIILYFLIPKKVRYYFLIFASLYFYINIKPIFALLLIGISIVTYLFAIFIENEKSDKKRGLLLNIGIIIILLPLFFFKYYNFVNESIFVLLEDLGLRMNLPEIALLLPIGISFYTFMAIGYIIDVYTDEVEAEKNFGYIMLFLSFFPLVLSGPIERAGNMLPQFKLPKNLVYTNVSVGLKLMLWGYFMKLVVADRLGIYTGAVYSNFELHNGTSLLLASILYPFQVYADLGGYSLIAIGAARILGINVMANFNRPFFATSMSELWRRWHMSLITWLTDYLYTPLSFYLRKYKIWGIVIALMLTFIISGIWHGANWTFIVWGAVQGIILSLEALSNKKKSVFEGSLVISIVPNIQDASVIFSKILEEPGALFIGSPAGLIYSTLGLSLLLLKDFTEEFLPNRFLFFNNNSKIIRVLSYSTIVIIILLIGVFDGGQFIYFQF